MKRLAFAAMLLLAACAAQAQVYRCGQTYSQKPCPDGKLMSATTASEAGNSINPAISRAGQSGPSVPGHAVL